MKTTTIFLWLLALVGTGCVQTQPGFMGDKATIAQINKRASNANARITFENGATRLVNNLNIGPDSLSWMDVDSSNVQSMPNSSIAAVSFIESESTLFRGIGGALLGMVGGSFVGYVIGVTRFGPGIATEIYMPSGAILGGGAGVLLGMLTSVPTGVVYEFKQFERTGEADR